MRYMHPEGYADKCTFCLHRVQTSRDPACVDICPTKALVFGDLNDPESDISVAVRERGGERLLEDKGTNPQTFYLSRRRKRPL